MKTKAKSLQEHYQTRFLNRRQFLVGSGQVMLAIPTLTSLMPRHLRAQVQGQPKVRYIGGLGYLGIDSRQWSPAEQSDMVIVPGQESVAYKALSQISGPISRVVDSSFTDLYSHMNVITGLSLTGGNYQGHNTSVLAGSHSGFREPLYGKSLDVIIEKSPSVFGSDFTGLKAIRMGDNVGHMGGFSFDRIDGKRISSQHLQGDQALFNALLGDLSSSSVEDQLIKAKKQSVVDLVFADLKSLESNPKLSKADKNILDLYMTSMQELKRKVASNQAQCTKPTIAFEVNKKGNFYHFPNQSEWGVQSIDAMYDNYIEMFKVAAMCDRSRVFHWSLSKWDHNLVAGGTAGGLHHEAPSSEIQADRQQYFIKKLAQLARVFRDTPDPLNSGSLLDNSIIFYANELGDWTTGHSTFNMPTVTFGAAGGKIRTGYYMDYRQRPLTKWVGHYPGRPYKQLLQSIMLSMGVPQSEYMQFGDGNGFGEFKSAINQFGKKGEVFLRYASEHNNPLPFFYKG